MDKPKRARSDSWRIKRSAVPEIEGANILRALGKFAGMSKLGCGLNIRFHSKNSFIKFDGNDENLDTIFIRAHFDDYPVSGENVDLMVSSVLHEAAHHAIKSREVCKHFKSEYHYSEGHPFWYFLNIGEDILCERVLKFHYPNLLEYRKIAKEFARKNKPEYNKESLLETWCEIELFGNTFALVDMPAEMAKHYEHLQALTNTLFPSQQISDRTIEYRICWEAIKEYVLNEDIISVKTSKRDEKGDGEDKGSDDGAPSDGIPKETSLNNKGTPSQVKTEPTQPKEYMSTPEQTVNSMGQDLDPRLEERMRISVEKEEEDITEEISEFLRENNHRRSRSSPIVMRKERKSPIVPPDPDLTRKLNIVMAIKKRLQSRTLRGELSGKIDRRKLARAATDGKIFKQKFKFPSEFPKAAIVVDCSGSIDAEEARQIASASSAMASLTKCGVYGYFETHNDHVYITRMDEPLKGVHTMRSIGCTPSGEAILAVARTLPKDGLLIHLTDGDYNRGISPREVCPLIKRELGVNVVNIIWGGYAATDTKYCGLSYEKIGGLENFPEALKRVSTRELGVKL